MSVSPSGILDQLGVESKKVLSTLQIDVKDLISKLDLNDTLNKENIVSVNFENGKYVTKIRIPNNVVIYKDDLKNIPLLLTVIDQGDIKGSQINLNYFPIKIQTDIALVFMRHHGYITTIDNKLYFTNHILDLFNTEWWITLFELARTNTLTYIDLEVENGSQPIKNRELIYSTGLIKVDEFSNVAPQANMDILWALGIYFFDKIVRNWINQEPPEVYETDTIMDVDLSPGKYIKTLDAKNFFLDQLRIFIGLRPNKIWFGGNYQSKFYEMIQKKATTLNKTIIMEELSFFTNYMNQLYSGGNNVLNGANDSGTEPFAITNLVYSEEESGIHNIITITIYLSVNLYGEVGTYKLPVSTKIN